MKAALPIFAATLALSPLTHAATVYSSGVFNNAIVAVGSDSGFPQWAASQFTLSSDISLNSIKVEGIYKNNTPGTDKFNVAILAGDGSSIPGALIRSYSPSEITSTSVPESGMFSDEFKLYQQTLSLPSTMSLPAGTYWLSVANESAGGNWLWVGSGQSNKLASSPTSQTNSYFPGGNIDLVYSLEYTAVPEPSALALSALGLGFLLRRKRK